MSRIIAGRAAGTTIATPSGRATRPTTDRTREALFSALASWAGGAGEAPDHQLDGIAFLDLFAGSGAIGLEAASRGATPVVMVDSSSQAVNVIRSNIATTKLSASAQRVSASSYLAGEATPFDVIFADPPYDMASSQVNSLIDQITGHGWLADDGLLVVERAKRDEPVTTDVLTDTWQRTYSDLVLYFFQAER